MQKRFGEIIKEARLEKELTLADVSKSTGLALTCLSEIENGHRMPPYKESVIFSLAALLSVSYEFLHERALFERGVRQGEGMKRLFTISPTLAYDIGESLRTMDDDTFLTYAIKIRALLKQ